MNYRIRFSSGAEFPQPEQATPTVTPMKSGREWRRIDVIGTTDEVKAAFVDGAQYSQVWDEVTEVIGDDGKVTKVTEEYSRDLSEWSVAGEIVDHRDGTVAVLMGKKTELEKMQESAATYDFMADIIAEGVNSIG